MSKGGLPYPRVARPIHGFCAATEKLKNDLYGLICQRRRCAPRVQDGRPRVPPRALGKTDLLHSVHGAGRSDGVQVWHLAGCRQYLKAYGACDNGATGGKRSASRGAKKSCHGAKLHFLATTSYEPRSGRMVADRYRQSTLVRLETYLKRFYAKRPESLKNSLRGDERVRVRPATLNRQVLDLKTLLPNQVDAASRRRRRSRRIQARARVATPSKKLYEIARIVGDRPWQYQIKWKGYAAPTWEPKQVLRHDLGDAQYEALVRAFHANELDGNDGGKEVGKQHKQRRK